MGRANSRWDQAAPQELYTHRSMARCWAGGDAARTSPEGVPCVRLWHMSERTPQATQPPLPRRVFCNRTLNMRSIQAVGLDMDYTLVHYEVEAWERKAYEHARRQLSKRGWPIDDLTFDPELACLGLVIDLELGNVVKVNRFGHVRRASHGTRQLSRGECLKAYSETPVELSEDRWSVMDTLFSLSEACLYMQLVDLLEKRKLAGVMGYGELYHIVRGALDATHMEGKLKAEIMAAPDKYVVLDEELPLTLLDLKNAGKSVLLITNSEWEYTQAMMSYALNRFAPDGDWRSFFDLVVVQARKPSFFSNASPVFKLMDKSGLCRPEVGKLERGEVYIGGNARLVEDSLGIRGSDILYIGDHIFADVYVSKDLLRWRTALVVRELEAELAEVSEFEKKQELLNQWMSQKAEWEFEFSQLRLELQRAHCGYGDAPEVVEADHKAAMKALRTKLVALDQQITEQAREAGSIYNQRWGQLMRCGNDKSHLARQVERYADLYMTRVSNLLAYTPFMYYRAARGTMPHDVGLGDEWSESEGV